MSKKIITGDDGKKYTVKEKKPFYKKWWFWILIVIIAIIIFAGISSGSSDDSASSSSSVSSHSISNNNESNSSNTVEQSSSITDTSSSNNKDDNSSAKAVTLGAGTYTVGEQIQPGRYIIKAVSGSGNVTSEGGFNDINIILGQQPDNSDGQVSSYTATLTKGMSIKLDGINQTSFTPVVGRKYLTQLPAGQWVVGKDIKPGRYKITAVSGSGNLTSDDGDVNEILGTTADQDTGQVTNVTENLYKGEVITSDIQEINLSAE